MGQLSKLKKVREIPGLIQIEPLAKDHVACETMFCSILICLHEVACSVEIFSADGLGTLYCLGRTLRLSDAGDLENAREGHISGSFQREEKSLCFSFPHSYSLTPYLDTYNWHIKKESEKQIGSELVQRKEDRLQM